VLGGGCDEQTDNAAYAALPLVALVLVGASGMRRRREV
jgi:MYXO-CTERM domain-containing protein